MRELHLDMVQSGQLPLTRVWEIFKYFRTAPPVHLLIRDWCGYKNEEAASEEWMPSAILADAPRMKVIPPHILRQLEIRKAANAT
jgi:hypothetical protein